MSKEFTLHNTEIAKSNSLEFCSDICTVFHPLSISSFMIFSKILKESLLTKPQTYLAIWYVHFTFKLFFIFYLIRGDNFVLHQKIIPITSIWLKLHKNVFRYVLEIYFPNFFNQIKIINKSRDLPMTSLWNSPSIPRSNSHKIKSAVTLSKIDV